MASQPGCCAAGVVSAKKDCAHTKTHVNTRAHVKGNAVKDQFTAVKDCKTIGSPTNSTVPVL